MLATVLTSSYEGLINNPIRNRITLLEMNAGNPATKQEGPPTTVALVIAENRALQLPGYSRYELPLDAPSTVRDVHKSIGQQQHTLTFPWAPRNGNAWR